MKIKTAGWLDGLQIKNAQENTMRHWLKALAVSTLACSPAVYAESALPFMKDMAGERELPLPWGIDFDFFTMDQDYDVGKLVLDIPGVVIPDSSQIDVNNKVQHMDIKLDVWLLPFLNVFGILGHVQNDTVVDLSRAPITGLPFPITQLPFDSDGTVLGGGFTLAYGGDRWFTSVTTTYTDTDLGGSFDSSVESLTIQPRVGLLRGNWVAWVGGMYLDTEETHSGTESIPGLGEFGFDVVLNTKDDWNAAVGVAHHFSPKANLSFELGMGDRTHTLFNFNYRF